MLVPFILGLVSSLHCIGMCGPLAMMVPGTRTNQTGYSYSKWMNPLLYNLGRVTTYAVFGFIFGLIGRSFAWFGWQQIISITLGILILVMLVLPGRLKNRKSISDSITKTMNKIRGRMSKLLFDGHPASLFGFGLLNGLLPCGMVYLALAGAIATDGPASGTIFMAVFGLGTLPAMWAISFLGASLGQGFRL